MALGLTFVYMVAEAVGGWYTNSLALIADAGHMLTDVAALCLTLGAFWFAQRPATSRKTYGYYRLEILAAFVNGIVLVLLSVWVIYEAVGRWNAPPDVRGFDLVLIASGGLLINIVAAYLLNGLAPESRRRLEYALLDAASHGARVLVLEPIARAITPWWEETATRFVAAGGRADEWHLDTNLPPPTALLGKAAGLNSRELKVRSLYVA